MTDPREASRSLGIGSDYESARTARRWLSKELRGLGLGPAFIAETVLAVGEVLTNIIRHGYRNRAGRPIEIRLAMEKEQVRIVISDEAPAFELRPAPLFPGELAEGGYGLYLVRRLMDEFRNETGPSGHNCFHLAKKFEAGGRAAS